MKKIFITVMLLIIGATIFLFLGLPPLAKNKLENKLAEAGFPSAVIGKTKSNFNDIRFSSISLDETKKMRIKEISVQANLILFILGRPIQNVVVDGLQYQQDIQQIRTLFRKKQSPEFLSFLDLPYERVELKNLKISVKGLPRPFNVTANLLLTSRDDNYKSLSGKVHTNSPYLKFQSNINGILNANRAGNIDFDVSQGDMNHTLLSIKDFSGWLNYSKKENEAFTISSQLDADNGNILKVATSPINITLGNDGEGMHNLLFRSKVRGIEDVNFSLDFGFNETTNDFKFMAAINTAHLADFLSYLRQSSVPELPIMASFSNTKQTKLELYFLPEKKFADGPLPFELTGTSNGKTFVKGTLLAYQDDLSLRGTIETDDEKVKDFQRLFDLPDENISENVLRIDSNLREFYSDF